MTINYFKIAGVFGLAFVLNLIAPDLLQHLAKLETTEATLAATLWCVSLFLSFGWLCSKVSEGTLFPSFTLQLLVGIVLHDALAPLSAQLVLAVVVCTAMAAIILKSGGDEIERQDFLKIAWPTVLIATVGYLVTFFVMFPVLMALGLDSQTAALLSAIIGSTDPAALIPTLKTLLFKPQYKQISNLSVAESALNDAVGAIFTGAIATMILAGVNIDNVSALAAGLFSGDNLRLLAAQFGFGIVAGVLGWGWWSACGCRCRCRMGRSRRRWSGAGGGSRGGSRDAHARRPRPAGRQQLREVVLEARCVHGARVGAGARHGLPLGHGRGVRVGAVVGVGGCGDDRADGGGVHADGGAVSRSFVWYGVAFWLAIGWDLVSGEPVSVPMAVVCGVVVGEFLRRMP